MKFLEGLGKDTEKNHTHMKKVGHTSEFPFVIYWWTLKNPKNHNFEKMEKNCWRYRHFVHVYQKRQSYEVQFLIYRVTQILFVILDHFLPFTFPHPNNPENQNVEKMKKAFTDPIILNLPNKNTIKWCMLNQIWSAADIFFVILGHFLLFYPTIDPKNLNWEKM